MAGSFALALAFVVIGIIVTVALPGAGLVIGVILIILGILLLIGGFAAGKRAGTAPSRR
jgi:hypothetical protein